MDEKLREQMKLVQFYGGVENATEAKAIAQTCLDFGWGIYHAVAKFYGSNTCLCVKCSPNAVLKKGN